MSKCIVITGAGGGLGRTLARQLAADGNTIFALGRTEAALDTMVKELGPACHKVVCDVANADSVRAAFATIGKTQPKIDVLINNAAIYQPSSVVEISDAQIEAALMINFAGPVYCSRAVLPMMQRGGHIINISSEVVGLPYAMFALYQSSKAGMERFTESLHDEVQGDGIRVTIARAGQMMDADSKSPTSGDLARRFLEENIKRGVNLRERPISSFVSAAKVICSLVYLPEDVNVPKIFIEARHR